MQLPAKATAARIPDLRYKARCLSDVPLRVGIALLALLPLKNLPLREGVGWGRGEK
jgi:hypothetical protein